jgi:hypothetical protein
MREKRASTRCLALVGNSRRLGTAALPCLLSVKFYSSLRPGKPATNMSALLLNSAWAQLQDLSPSSGDQVSESILLVTFASLLYWTLPQILNYML